MWIGGELDPKTRSFCSISALIATGRPQVHGHIRAALAVGATRQEIADVITHIAFYAGFPSAGNAVRAAREVCSIAMNPGRVSLSVPPATICWRRSRCTC